MIFVTACLIHACSRGQRQNNLVRSIRSKQNKNQIHIAGATLCATIRGSSYVVGRFRLFVALVRGNPRLHSSSPIGL